MFERILGQASVKAKLGRALEMGNITNAYLLTGPEGVGKRMIAEDFAENLLGVRLENSPDYKCIGVKKGENSIKIDQIRDMIGDMSIKPYGNYKIFDCPGPKCPFKNFRRTLSLWYNNTCNKK